MIDTHGMTSGSGVDAVVVADVCGIDDSDLTEDAREETRTIR